MRTMQLNNELKRRSNRSRIKTDNPDFIRSFLQSVVVLMLTVHCHAASAPYTIPRHIEYAFTLQNTTNQVVEQVELWTYAPTAFTATQQRVQIRASELFSELTDRHGNSILHVTIPQITPYAAKILTISVDLALAEEPQPIPEETDLSQYLQSGPYCEVDDYGIIALAQQLVAETQRETAQHIFQWVSRNITYSGYLKAPRGARYALEHKQGDCTEFMYLFVALCRAAGIPARGIGGYVVNRNTILKPGDYHNWAEFYLDGIWHVADPQERVFMENQSHYLMMHVIGDMPDNHPMQQYQRFRYGGGNGLEVIMN